MSGVGAVGIPVKLASSNDVIGVIVFSPNVITPFSILASLIPYPLDVVDESAFLITLSF